MLKNKKNLVKIIIFAIVGIAVIIAAIFIARSGVRSGRFNKLMKSANEYLTDLDYKSAVETYKDAIEINPKSADAYIGLADAYIGLEKFSKAESALKNGLKILPEDKNLLEKLEEVQKMIEEQDEDKKADEDQTNENQTNENQTNENQTNENLTDEQQSGEQQPDEQNTEENQTATETVNIEEQNQASEDSNSVMWLKTREISYRDGNISSVTEYAYDNNGNLVSETEYASDMSTITGFTAYEYDAAGRKISAYDYEKYFGEYYYSYEYDAEGKLSKTVKSDSTGAVCTYETYSYDANGRVTKAVIYLSDGTEDSYFESVYDSNGNLIEYIECYIDSYMQETTYEYDANGYLIKEYYFEVGTENISTYEYDSNGNAIRVIYSGYADTTDENSYYESGYTIYEYEQIDSISATEPVDIAIPADTNQTTDTSASNSDSSANGESIARYAGDYCSVDYDELTINADGTVTIALFRLTYMEGTVTSVSNGIIEITAEDASGSNMYWEFNYATKELCVVSSTWIDLPNGTTYFLNR